MGTSKKLGLPSAIAVAVGLIVASSCLLLLGNGMGLAGQGFIISMAIVFVLNALLALSFNELYCIMPNVDGGLGQYTKAALGAVPSIISNVSAYVMVNLLAVSVELAVSGMVINQIFLPSISAPVISIFLLLLLALVNYFGINIFSKIQNIVVSLLLLSLVGMGLISALKLGTGELVTAAQQTAPVVNDFGGYVSLSAMAFWLFIGIEFVIPVAKNLKNPKRDIPLAMILGISILFVIQSLLGSGMTNYVTLDVLASSDLPHMVFAANVLGHTGEIWMGIVTVLAAVSTANTVFAGIPRVLQGMSENDLLPAAFAKTNKKDVAIVGLFFLTIGNCILIATGLTNSAGLTSMLLAASCFWLTSYILVNVTVLVLRKRFPDYPTRNKKLIFWGVPQIISIIGNIYMIINIAEGDQRIFIYTLYGIILVAMVIYSVIWVKFVKKMPMFKGSTMEEIQSMK